MSAEVTAGRFCLFVTSPVDLFEQETLVLNAHSGDRHEYVLNTSTLMNSKLRYQVSEFTQVSYLHARSIY